MSSMRFDDNEPLIWLEVLTQSKTALEAASAIGISYDALKSRLTSRGFHPPSYYLGRPDRLPVQHPQAEHAKTLSSDEPCHVVKDKPAAEADPRKDPTLHLPNAPEGYHLRGVSTLTDADGKPVMRWVKTAQDPAAVGAALMLEAIKSLSEPLRLSHYPSIAPSNLDADLLCIYKVPDPHLGLMGWNEEVGKDYDLKIAEDLHLSAIKQLAQVSPPAKQALVLTLGDFLHADDNLARTARSGNPLDTDSRFAKVLRVGVRMARAMVDCALERHERVTVIVEIGNHDTQASIMLATAMSLIYERDPRVTVDTSPSKFHWFRFGKCLIGTTHGSDVKADKLPMIMAHDKPEDWGTTEHRQWYVGHWHHESIKEFPGVTVEFCRTLAGPDAWAHGAGYRSERGMRCDIWHREWGLVSFNQIGLGQLEAAKHG